MVCLVSTNDLLALYMAIELMSLSFYILAAYKRNSEFSGEAGLKYFILGAFLQVFYFWYGLWFYWINLL